MLNLQLLFTTLNIKTNIKNSGLHLKFYSGRAKVEINQKEDYCQTDDKINGCLALIEYKINEN
jgi:hypothetical protein